MTEFDTVQTITEKIGEAESKISKLRNAKYKAKRNLDNSTEIEDKKNVLAGLKQLQSSNNKAFSNVTSDADRDKLVDRARELNLEIATVEKEIADFSKVIEDLDKETRTLIKEVERLEKKLKIVRLKEKLDDSIAQSSSFDDALDAVEDAFNHAFNYQDAFEDDDFVNDAFSQETIKRILSVKFDEKQIEVLMGISSRRAVSFISDYADDDDIFDMTVGVYFSTLRAQIEMFEALVG